VADHRDIAAALERRDGERACELVAAHLRSARDAARGARAS
jgi:DNA-binding GntR family transcriptional regulator